MIVSCPKVKINCNSSVFSLHFSLLPWSVFQLLHLHLHFHRHHHFQCFHKCLFPSCQCLTHPRRPGQWLPQNHVNCWIPHGKCHLEFLQNSVRSAAEYNSLIRWKDHLNQPALPVDHNSRFLLLQNNFGLSCW